ncbi:putative mediator of RNA polymerase II transcription subunit 26 [Bombus impatiens]|uniref:Mediator of RNA polymerase II transcription subunit 26 n=1 Tax=Bombus impatiens TaxID=132113 RepID=A0A6P3DZ91_BOMIM|nr:putative mediator of RNA polymerase II transcription subunit 26 [Bombus impatiens]
MAPHIQRDYNAIGDPGRYSLRTLRHGEKNCFQSHTFDVSKISSKEDFFRCIGLQMKRFQYKYRMSNSDRKTKKINIPSGVTLRDCSVIILGNTCNLCGKCFKCKIDLDKHNLLKHQTNEELGNTTVKETQCTEKEIEICKNFPKSLNHSVIKASKNFATKEHKKLRLTLKIGEEIIAKISVNRKYLKKDNVDMWTQTESNRDTELIADMNMYESVASRIDPLLFGNSPCQCFNPSVHTVQCSNRYLASNIVASTQAVREKIITQEETNSSHRLKESRDISANEKRGATLCVTPNSSLELNLSFVTEKCNLREQDRVKNGNSEELSSTHSDDALIFDETCNMSQFAITSKSMSSYNKKNDSVTSSTKNTNTRSRNTMQINPENIDENEETTNINTNPVQKDFIINNTENYILRKLQDDSNVIQAILPVIVPIIMPNASVPSTPIKLMIQSASIKPKEQQLRQKQQQQLQPDQQLQLRQKQRLQVEHQEQPRQDQQQQEITEISSLHTEDNSNDGMQQLKLQKEQQLQPDQQLQLQQEQQLQSDQQLQLQQEQQLQPDRQLQLQQEQQLQSDQQLQLQQEQQLQSDQQLQLQQEQQLQSDQQLQLQQEQQLQSDQQLQLQQEQQLQSDQQLQLQQEQQLQSDQQLQLQQEQQLQSDQQLQLQQEQQLQSDQQLQLQQEQQLQSDQQLQLQQEQQLQSDQQLQLQQEQQLQPDRQLQLQQEQQLQVKHKEQLQQGQEQQQIVKTLTHNAKDNSDDDVQEVLRIVRGHSTADVNHESPTRFEREMLLHVAIRDMKRLEGEGWHLLEKVIDYTGKKSKSSTKCCETNDECIKKMRKIITELDFDCRNSTKEKYISHMKEHIAKMQSYNSIATICGSDSVKENLMTCNENINISSKMTRQHNINHHKGKFEINNNTQSVEESVSHFLVPCPGDMESRSKGPIVIDLVNGTDE